MFWVEAAEVHEFHVNPIRVPEFLVNGSPQLELKLVEELTQLQNFLGVLARNCWSMGQVKL